MSAGPNFAFELCVTRVPDEYDELDLSSWRMALCGAEPILHHTLERFIDVFKCGFPETALFKGTVWRKRFYPYVGLHRRTAQNAAGGRGRIQESRVVASEDESQSLTIVSCGKPLTGQEVHCQPKHF